MRLGFCTSVCLSVCMYAIRILYKCAFLSVCMLRLGVQVCVCRCVCMRVGFCTSVRLCVCRCACLCVVCMYAIRILYKCVFMFVRVYVCD